VSTRAPFRQYCARWTTDRRIAQAAETLRRLFVMDIAGRVQHIRPVASAAPIDKDCGKVLDR
jgi:hypothetical protein